MFWETRLQTQVSYWYGQKAAVPPRFHYAQAQCFGKHVFKRRFPIGTVRKRQFHQGFTEVSLCAGAVFYDRCSYHQRFLRQTGKPSKFNTVRCVGNLLAHHHSAGTDHDLSSQASAKHGTLPGNAKKLGVIMEKRGGRDQIQKIDAVFKPFLKTRSSSSRKIMSLKLKKSLLKLGGGEQVCPRSCLNLFTWVILAERRLQQKKKCAGAEPHSFRPL